MSAGTRRRASSGPPSGFAGRMLAVALLSATYLLTLASLDPVDLAVAILLSVGVLYALREFLAADSPLGWAEAMRRAMRFPLFALAVGWEITIGTWRVAKIVAGLEPLRRPGIVSVPIGERSRTGVAVSALALTLSPGEVFVDVDWEQQVMLIHVLDASDPDAVREHHASFYERFQRGVFP